MILAGLERIAIQGRIWIDGYLKWNIRGTEETELEPKRGYCHVYPKRDGSGIIRLYIRGDDNVEREIQTTP
jgi:hypothetical protein